MRHCEICDSPVLNKRNRFCSHSCAATFRNTGVRRHGQPAGVCILCGKSKGYPKAKYCSTKCCGLARVKPDHEKRRNNAANQARYRARHGYLRAYDPEANIERIKQIYADCPKGYEVDHIIPLSKGGKHHEDNLQYLTITENRSKGARSSEVEHRSHKAPRGGSNPPEPTIHPPHT